MLSQGTSSAELEAAFVALGKRTKTIGTPARVAATERRRKRHAANPAAKEHELARNRATTAKWREDNREYLAQRIEMLRDYCRAVKTERGCKDCGEKHPLCLDFDHRDPKTKLFELSAIGRNVTSLSMLKAEIAKCDVLCANCHRIKTYLDRVLYGVM